MWATFDEGLPTADPGLVLTGGAPHVAGRDLLDRAGVRLSDDDVAEDVREIYLAEYERRDTEVYVSTVADAGEFFQFRPSTRAAGQPGMAAPPSGAPGVPEVVHEQVHADRLLPRSLGRHAL